MAINCDYLSDTRTWLHHLPLTIETETDLPALLTRYFEDITLTDSTCPGCGGKSTLHKQFQISQYPIVLAIHVLRFNNNTPRINTKISLPLTITTNQFASDEFSSISISQKYELVAIINHIPITPQQAHYTTIVRHPNDYWLLFDDAKVEIFDFTTLDLSQPYMLFYQRQTVPDQTKTPNDLLPKVSLLHITFLI